jgi:hypothetical protein
MNRERTLKIVLVVVGLLFSATVYPLTTFLRSEAALAMMLSLYVILGIFLLMAVRNPSGESQPDRLHGMVEFCSRRCHGGAVSPRRARTGTSAGRRGWVRYHSRSLDRADPAEAVSRAGIGSRCIKPKR